MFTFIIVTILLFGATFVFTEERGGKRVFIRNYIIATMLAIPLTWGILEMNASDNAYQAQNEANAAAWLAKMRANNCAITAYAGDHGQFPVWTCPNQKDVIIQKWK